LATASFVYRAAVVSVKPHSRQLVLIKLLIAKFKKSPGLSDKAKSVNAVDN